MVQGFPYGKLLQISTLMGDMHELALHGEAQFVHNTLIRHCCALWKSSITIELLSFKQ
jgi:hypothetical protein